MPNSVVVILKELKPIGFWQDKLLLVTADGVLFALAHLKNSPYHYSYANQNTNNK